MRDPQGKSIWSFLNSGIGLRVSFAATVGVIIGHTFLAILMPGALFGLIYNISSWLGRHEDLGGNLIAAAVTLIAASIAWTAVQKQIKISTRNQDEALMIVEGRIQEQINAIAGVWRELDKQALDSDRLNIIYYGIENTYRFQTVWTMFTHVLSVIENDWVVSELSSYDKKKIESLNRHISFIIGSKKHVIDDFVEKKQFDKVQYIVRDFSNFAHFVDIIFPNLAYPLYGLKRTEISHTTFSHELHRSLQEMDGHMDLADLLRGFKSPLDR